MISLSQERTDSLLRGDMRTKPAYPPHDLQREFTNSSCCRCSSAGTNSRMVGNEEVIGNRLSVPSRAPETEIAEITRCKPGSTSPKPTSGQRRRSPPEDVKT